jgi:hypothetical protein
MALTFGVHSITPHVDLGIGGQLDKTQANQVSVNHFSNAVVCVLLLDVRTPLSSGLVRARDRAQGQEPFPRGFRKSAQATKDGSFDDPIAA